MNARMPLDRAALLVCKSVIAAVCGLGGTSALAQPVVCIVSTVSPAFASYVGSTRDGVGYILVSCPTGLPPSVAIGISAGQSPSGGQRRMSLLTHRLSYELYCDGTRNNVWGELATGGVCNAAAPFPASSSRTVYARIPSGQYPQPGLYADTLTVTVRY